MEINITKLVDHFNYLQAYSPLAGNVMELGNNAGKITWQNALDYIEENPLLDFHQIDDVRDYFAEFGAWTREELAAMTINEIQALTAQEIACRLRENDITLPDEITEDTEIDGIYRNGNDIYFYMGL